MVVFEPIEKYKWLFQPWESEMEAALTCKIFDCYVGRVEIGLEQYLFGILETKGGA